MAELELGDAVCERSEVASFSVTYVSGHITSYYAIHQHAMRPAAMLKRIIPVGTPKDRRKR
jgi:hypothetical protein